MLLSLVALAAAQVADPAEGRTAETEMLGIDAPDEFQVGSHGRNAQAQIIEMVDPPETVDTWSKLITLQSFFGLVRLTTADSFYNQWREAMGKACGGMTSVVTKGAVDGMPSLKATLSCPLNPQTGNPRISLRFLFRALRTS